MKNIKKLFRYFSKGEIILWSCSIILISVFFFLFDRINYLRLAASVIGITSLIFNAKGNPFGQILMIIFSLLYGIISFSFAYYGEMLTYIGMTLPMSVIALIAWIKNPYNGNKAVVKVNNNIKKGEFVFLSVLTFIVTIIFFFILKVFHTASLIPSTLSVTTSFIAVYLTFRRSPYYAIGYSANDIVLVVLWTIASFENISYISIVICFFVFLVNDIYGFISWKRMGKKQLQNI